jgi:hypothetical protein
MRPEMWKQKENTDFICISFLKKYLFMQAGTGDAGTETCFFYP